MILVNRGLVHVLLYSVIRYFTYFHKSFLFCVTYEIILIRYIVFAYIWVAGYLFIYLNLFYFASARRNITLAV